MLTLLTATGARPEAFALCERWMAAQDYAGLVHWVIVDDGPDPQHVTTARDGWTVEVIRPTPLWEPGQNTQARNLLAGLVVIGEDARVVCIEDDDHYAPDWLAHIDAQLDHAELVGEGMARYYNVALRVGRQLNNLQHASLCSTAVRGRAIDTLRRVCQLGAQFIDIALWRLHPSRHVFGGHRVTGIKGLPGRGGIGMGHKPEFSGTPDPDGRLLREWIGDDAMHYGVK